MDLFLKATFKSDQPREIKRKLLNNIKKTAVQTLPNKSLEERTKTIYVAIHFLLGGDVFENTECKKFLDLVLPLCHDVIEAMFTTNSIEMLFDGTWKEPQIDGTEDESAQFMLRILVSRRMDLIDLLLSGGTKKMVACQKIPLIFQAETIKLLYDSQDHKTFASVCQVLTKHPQCMPPMSKGFAMCTLSLHAISDFQFYGNTDAVPSYIQDVAQIAELLQLIWKKEPATLIPSLQEIFKIISAEKEPSNALGYLVKFIPVELTNTVVYQIVHDSSISDSAMYLALTRMTMWLSWPTSSRAHIWILRFFTELAEAKKYAMLIDVTIKSYKQVFLCLRMPMIRHSALEVLVYMLLSYRVSPDVFHSIIADIPQMIASIEKENKADVNEIHLKTLANLCYCQMYLHTGFPELYTSLLQAIKRFPRPKRIEMDEALQVTSWSNNKEATFHEVEQFHFDVRSKETDRAGLVNLGNTCFLNSITQALFMANGFRYNILKYSCRLPHGSKMRLLEKTFASLLLTERLAYEPKDLVEYSRPPWFISGSQQDCSEYLKYFLDQLHEEEKSLLQNVTRSGETHVPNDDSSHGDVQTTSAVPVAMETDQPEVTTPSTRSIVSKLFHGKSKIIILCQSCRGESSRVETFVDIALPLDVSSESTPVGGKGGCVGGDPPKLPTTEGSNVTPFINSACSSSEGTSAFVDDAPIKGFPVQSHDDVIEDPYDVTSPPKSHNLVDMITNYLSEETMEGDNQYFCSHCNRLQNAIKRTEIIELPTYLVITLMRFTYNTSEQRRTKIIDNVNIALDITVPLRGSTDQQQSYNLWAIVVHSGTSAESGHYYCYARQLPSDPDTWYLFNDSHVSLTSYSSIEDLSARFLRDTAYVLMYRKAEGSESEGLSLSLDGKDLVCKELAAAIEADNNMFLKELTKSKNRSNSSACSNVLGWNNDNPPPPPPSFGGGGGDGGSTFQSNRLVF
uniref:Ubiquitin carboxyl-terminal hydrolase 38-like n=1 Tax=Phallusia mammillata TaxID=59560 RepID=A0A6F9DWZ2_9ASCI|nr:ubiquitin carboxyl-terminal hydrolase 38-like [Phallusia mammillata]